MLQLLVQAALDPILDLLITHRQQHRCIKDRVYRRAQEVMFDSNSSRESSYALLDHADEDGAVSEKPQGHRTGPGKSKAQLILGVCFVAIIGIAVGFITALLFARGELCGTGQAKKTSTLCKDAHLRREWRSLDRTEKKIYIKAVKCLKTLPSDLGLNHTLYDDFPWIHKHIGEYSHDAAPFLAWHRYFIHSYEKMLQQRCDYDAHLPYWDWTLDWENITISPIWDTETGFGGNGNVNLGSPVFDAHCVTEGPFALLDVPYFEDIYKPHCLLRGFDKNLAKFRQDLHPDALDKLLLLDDYNTLNLGLENGPHVAIPKSINGDFSLHTAPFGNYTSL